MIQKSAAILFAVLFFLGCKPHKDQPQPAEAITYREYFVTYDKTKDSTAVFAIIHDTYSGDTMEIPVANLTVNGLTGTRNPDNTFAWYFQGMPDIQFAYKTSTQTITDQVLRSDLGDMNFNASTPAEFSRTDTGKFTVDCSPLDPSANQEIFIGLDTTTSNQVLVGANTAYTKLSDNNVIFAPLGLRFLSPGTYYLILYRKHYVKLLTNGQAGYGEVVPELKIERKAILK